MYLSCGIRPNIAFAIGQLNKHNSDPEIGYIRVVKKVMYYLKGILHLELVYRAQAKDEKETKALITLYLFGFVEYGDSSYARTLKNRKLVIKYCYFNNGAIVS